MHPLEKYIQDLRWIRATGVNLPETSYYPALSDLLNEVGKTLKPKVHCVMQIQKKGGGIPDGGLFTPDQFQKGAEPQILPGTPPARGAIEAKPLGENARDVARSEQVQKYLATYGQVLVTNFRDFLLVVKGPGAEPDILESYSLGASEPEFWAETIHPVRMVKEQGDRFVDFLKRVMLHNAPLSAPADVAWFLASYAREAKARIERVDLPALAGVRKALEEALGLKFEGEKGEHFFRSTLVQTLFYGVFSAWVLWSQRHPYHQRKEERFDWRIAGWSLRVPVISALFDQVATPSKLEPLGLVEVLDWSGAVLNRVDRESFFGKFEREHAVQYFYEPFLQAYDPELRKELGVWYTPPEIVKYMVARVDTVLREELEIADGLADPRVVVLDPCCGTGAYLVETLRHVYGTLQKKGSDALLGDDLKQAAMHRVFGFEILPAPFVISHLQIGLLLDSLGASLADGGERAGVFLTNALTGWEPPDEAKEQAIQLGLAGMPELQQERDAAAHVKRDERILVVIGNPPYNAFAGVSPEEEKGLVEPYKKGLISDWGIKKFNLDDLYVRFFRLAERRIAEMTKRGVVCYISNHSWLSDPSFAVLRRHLLQSFDKFWIENMHGNRKISEYAPDGRTSETIFAIPGFSAGIQQGVAISLWAKTGKGSEETRVLFRDDIDHARAVDRRAALLESLEDTQFQSHYQTATPEMHNRFSFRPSEVADEYMSWPRLTDLCAEPPSNGLMEKRGGALIDIDRQALEKRMKMYYDPAVDWTTLRGLGTGLTEDATGFDPRKIRTKVQAAEQYEDGRILRYVLRPFDTRWCYYSSVSPFWNRCRPRLYSHCWPGNSFLISRVGAAKDPEGSPFYYSQVISDDHLLAPDASCFPLKRSAASSSIDGPMWASSTCDHKRPADNLSEQAHTYMEHIGITNEQPDLETASLIWMHALAIGYSPAYLKENAGGIRQDWPRIPLPDSQEALLHSAALGRQVAALLDTETAAPGVTSGAVRPEMAAIGLVTSVRGKNVALDSQDLALTAGWGHPGKDGVTMPGKGKLVEREYTPEERGAIVDGAQALGLDPQTAFRRFGEKTCDVYLNDVAYWRNIPVEVWGYYIGGYQVIKKWLSYREEGMLGRPLTTDEVREVMNMARRIATILLLEPALDENYRKVKENTYPWPAEGQRPASLLP